MDKENYLELVRERGGPKRVCKDLGIPYPERRQYLYRWRTACPPRKVKRVAKYFGVPPSALRPDIFGDTQ